MEILIAIFGVILLVGFVIIYSTFSWGFVTYKLWYWFLLPIFPMLPQITFWQAIGIALFISLFKYPNEGIKSEYKDKTSHGVTTLLLPWILLLISYLINILFIK